LDQLADLDIAKKVMLLLARIGFSRFINIYFSTWITCCI